ncbi:hypothetical protein [Velocimicrobium porci]|nr:hypothetical protein [Velocimicrobium porci]
MRTKDYRGSMTVEASFVLPIFFFAIMFFIYFFLILSVQTIVGESLLQTGRFLSKYGTVREINKPTLQVEFQKNLSLNSLNSSCIKGGRLGIRLICERSGIKEEEIVISAVYKIRIPVFVFKVSSISAKQTLKTRLFIGKNMKNNSGDGVETEKEKNDVIVYITETGGVYHKNKNCSHLKLSIKPILFDAIEQARNIEGGKYKSCERCGKRQKKQDIVFIALDGDRYHTSLQCSGLKRTIIGISLQKVKDWNCCKRCG